MGGCWGETILLEMPKKSTNNATMKPTKKNVAKTTSKSKGKSLNVGEGAVLQRSWGAALKDKTSSLVEKTGEEEKQEAMFVTPEKKGKVNFLLHQQRKPGIHQA